MGSGKRRARRDAHRPTRIASSLLFAVVVLLALAPSSGAKVAVDSFGLPGIQGGRLSVPTGIAINQAGAGGVGPGTIYVAESKRIQRLDPAGNFERLWGFDVKGPNEIQTVTIVFGACCGTLQQTVGGSFTLKLGADLGNEEVSFALEAVGSAIRPTPGEVQSSLEALPAIGAGNVRVSGGLDTSGSGGSYEIEFIGELGGTDWNQLSIDGTDIEGPTPITAEVATAQNGSGGNFAGFEICEVAADCKRGEASQASADGGEVGSPQGIAVNQSSGDVYANDWTNHRIDEFDADGHFLRAFGRDVVSTGGTGDISTEAFEVCTVAADCKAGLVNGDAGSVTFGRDIAIDSAGHVWLANGNNHRLEEFGESGNFIAAYGWDVDATGGSGHLEKCTGTAVGACQAGTVGTELGQFGGSENGSNPARMTVDTGDVLYVIDQGNDRIQRFDPSGLSATLFAPEFTGLSIEDGIQALPNGHFLLGVDAPDGDRLLDLDGSGHRTETSLEKEGVPTLEHIVENEASGRIYATIRNNGSDIPGVAMIDDGPPQPPPTLTIEPPSEVSGEAATLNATVDPGGLLVANCRFEYSTDQASWIEVPEPDCVTLDRDGGTQPVSERVEGLEPGTDYFVRFAAGRFYYAAAETTAPEEPLPTPPEPPLLSDIGAGRVTDTSAYLAGKIRPRAKSTEYHFEYGTNEGELSSSTPTEELVGSAERIIAQKIEGLEPETTYYLRLVAKNVAGEAEAPPPPAPPASFRTRPSLPIPPCPNQSLREEQGSTSLPDCRAYEQVSPPDKNFTDVKVAFNAAEGEAAVLCATQGFGEPPGQVGSLCAKYRSARGESGWRTRWLGEPYCQKDPQASYPSTRLNESIPVGYSADLDLIALRQPESPTCPYLPLDPQAPLPQANLYRADYRGGLPSYELLAPKPGGPLQINQGSGEYAAASEDWSHVIYTSAGNQTDPPDSPPPGDFDKVYDWHDGSLKLISKSTAGKSGVPLTTPSLVPDDALGGVSADGNRVFFMNPVSASHQCTPANCEIFMRESANKTFDVSQTECTSSCGSSGADVFLAAAPDGSKVLFMSEERLTNEDVAGNGADLYLYTHGANPQGEPNNLTLLSKDEEPADGSKAKVLGLLGMSADAEAVYFVAEGQLVAGAPTPSGPKLYRWLANEGSPTLDYLATLGPASDDVRNWTGRGLNRDRPAVREVSADGAHLLIDTSARLDLGADHDSDRDVYSWSQADGWLCISCQVPGTPSAGDATLPDLEGGLGLPVSNNYLYAMSEDGARAFFTSPDSLMLTDTNGRADAYEWREDGSLSLISSGTDSNDAVLIGTDRSGRDAFFATFEPLVGWDIDTNVDLYDARKGGGFPEPPSPGDICEPNGGGCNGHIDPAPEVPGCGTCVFEAPPEKAKPGPCPKGKVRRHGRCVPKHHHRKHHHRKPHRKRSQRRAFNANRGGVK